MKNQKKDYLGKGKYIIFLVLFIIAMLAGCGATKGEKFDWANIKLGEMLPEPVLKQGEIHTNTEKELWIDIRGISKEQYGEYVDKCKGKGFTIDAEDTIISYRAFADNGYQLNISYYESSEELSIKLEAPMEMEMLHWPQSDIASLLPIPKSTIGHTEWEAAYGFVIYVGDTSVEDFNEYADRCAEMGFSIDYRRGNDYYYADNAEGYHLTLNYKGNQVMFVRIDEPDKQEEVPTTNDEGENEEDVKENVKENIEEKGKKEEENVSEEDNKIEEEQVDESSSSAIRPEFQAAMDSYEAFFDEYCEFMKKYNKSTDTAELLKDYLDYMKKYTDAMQKLEKIGEEDMNDAELLYYTEVMGRINQKLIEAAVQ